MGFDAYSQGRGTRVENENDHHGQGADSRHVRNRTLPANGRVGDGKRGPVKKWKKLGG